MGIGAVDELIMHQIFVPPTKKVRIHVPIIVHEVNLFFVAWLGLFFMEQEVLTIFTKFLGGQITHVLSRPCTPREEG